MSALSSAAPGSASEGESARPASRPGSGRALALLLLGPLLTNGISLMLAVVMYLKAAQHYPPRDLLWLGFSYYLGYAVVSYLASRMISPRYAAWTIRGALVGLGLSCLLATRAEGYAAYLLFSLLNGGVIGFYFAPLQIAMRGVKPCRTVAWTIAFYNVSWGTGAALGPFVSGWLEELGSGSAAGGAGAGGGGWNLEAVVGVVVAVSVVVHLLLDWGVLPSGAAALRPEARPAAVPAAAAVLAAAGPAGAAANLPTPTAATSPVGFVSTARLRKIGFAGAAVITLVRTGVLTTLWPALCKVESLSAAQKGWGLFLMGMPVPLLAPMWATWHRKWARPGMSVALLALGAAGLGLMPWVGPALQLASLAAVGTAVSGLIYLAIFYANSDPRWPSNSVGVTEFFIGAGGLIGPMLLGRLAGENALSIWPYAVGGGLALAVAAGVVMASARGGGGAGRGAQECGSAPESRRLEGDE